MAPRPRLTLSNKISALSAADIAIQYGARGSLDELEFDQVMNLSLAPDRFGVVNPPQFKFSSVLPVKQIGQAVSLVNVINDTPPQNDESTKDTPIVSVPTADLITHTSFKSGSKFVIRVIPRQGPGFNRYETIAEIKNKALYFDKASLQSTAEIRDEKYSMFEGFDDYIIFLFGKRPKIWTFNFMVLNCSKPDIPTELNQPGREADRERFIEENNMDFTDDLIRRWNQDYRGTAAIQKGYIVYMSYEDILLEATLLSMVVSRNNMAGVANVTITFAVHEESFIGDSIPFDGDAEAASSLGGNTGTEATPVPASSIKTAPGDLTSVKDEKKKSDDDVLSAQDSASLAARELASVRSAMTESAARIELLEDAVAAINPESTDVGAQVEAARLEDLIQQERGNFSALEDAERAAQERLSESISELTESQVVQTVNEYVMAMTSSGDTSKPEVTARFVEVFDFPFDDPTAGQSSGGTAITVEISEDYRPGEDVFVLPGDISGVKRAHFDSLDFIKGNDNDQKRKKFESASIERYIDPRNYQLYDANGDPFGVYFAKSKDVTGVANRSYTRLVNGYLEDNVRR